VKLADAELHFSAGLLTGSKLVGFAVYRRQNGELSVTFPARTYSVMGERRSFALLRPGDDGESMERIRDCIIWQYKAWLIAEGLTGPGNT
jgi:hypothetical protein